MKCIILLIVPLVFLSCNHPVSVDDELVSNNIITLLRNDSLNEISVFADDELFTVFMFPSSLEKPILFPVYAPGGVVVTRGFPLDPRPGDRIDHPHQVGVWFNFGDVNGIDFWNNSYAIPEEQKDKFGYIVTDSVKLVEEDKTGIINYIAGWMTNNRKALLREKTSLFFSANDSIRTIERFTTLTALDTTVVFNDNKEGMFAIRVAREFETPTDQRLIILDEELEPMEKPVIDTVGVNGFYRSDTGLTGIEVWGTANKWVTLTGTKDGKIVSIGIIDHLENPAHPPHWHARDYGLFSACNFGQKSFMPSKPAISYTLQPGQNFLFRYKMLIKKGSALSKEVMENASREFNQR
ncbi:MAG: PmoA family protein [Bacteroidota bacterium]